MPGQAKPNFFIVGAPKCGTTSLYSYLETHPNIYLSPVKEPTYWSADIRHVRAYSSEDAYLELFRRVGKEHRIVGEGSTTYLSSDQALPRIMQFNPASKVVCVVRNPLDFMSAYHMEMCVNFQEDVEDLETAWMLQEQRRHGERIPPACAAPRKLDYEAAGSFGNQIQRLYEFVPAEQRLVLLFDDFVEDARQVYERVLQFLHLESDGRTDFPRLNEARTYRFQALRRLVYHPPRPFSAAVALLRRAGGPQGLNVGKHFNRVLRKRQPRRPISDDFRCRLSGVFAEDVLKLQELLKRDLSHWLRL